MNPQKTLRQLKEGSECFVLAENMRIGQDNYVFIIRAANIFKDIDEIPKENDGSISIYFRIKYLSYGKYVFFLDDKRLFNYKFKRSPFVCKETFSKRHYLLYGSLSSLITKLGVCDENEIFNLAEFIKKTPLEALSIEAENLSSIGLVARRDRYVKNEKYLEAQVFQDHIESRLKIKLLK